AVVSETLTCELTGWLVAMLSAVTLMLPDALTGAAMLTLPPAPAFMLMLPALDEPSAAFTAMLLPAAVARSRKLPKVQSTGALTVIGPLGCAPLVPTFSVVATTWLSSALVNP